MKPAAKVRTALWTRGLVRLTLCIVFLALSCIPTAAVYAQISASQSSPSVLLKQHYDQAEKLQSIGNLTEATEEYSKFLAEAVGLLANEYTKVPDYNSAAPLFDEALRLQPTDSLLLDYAQSALGSGDAPHARTLASRFIKKYPGNKEKLALAHQILGRALLKLDRDQEARKELEAAVALDPTFANGYDLAVACLDLNDEACAVQLFDEMQKSFGDNAEVHMAFGRAYAASDFQPRAVSEFKRAIHENAHLPEAHYLLAAVLLSTGSDDSHLQQAEAELSKELEISPRNASAYAALGRIAVTRDKLAQAETYLKKAIALAPQDPDAYLYLGQVYLDTDRTAEAQDALRACVRLTSDVSRNRYQVQKAHYLLGRILAKEGRQEAAKAELDRSHELSNLQLNRDKNQLQGMMDSPALQNSASPTVEAVASPLEARTRSPQALNQVEALKDQLKLAIADSYNNLGALAATSGDYASAVVSFEKASIWNPSLEGLDYNWGRAAFAGSKFGEAVLPLSRYVHAHPDDPGARGVLAVSQFMSNDYQGCIATLQPTIGKGPLVPQVAYAYAESLVRTGQVSPGVEDLTALEKSNPEMPEVHRALGEALLKLGDFEEAQREARLAIRLNQSDAEAHYDLGTILLDAGNPTKAIPELEAAVQLVPASEKYHKKLADGYAAAQRTADAQREIQTCDRLREQRTSGPSVQGVASP